MLALYSVFSVALDFFYFMLEGEECCFLLSDLYPMGKLREFGMLLLLVVNLIESIHLLMPLQIGYLTFQFPLENMV